MSSPKKRKTNSSSRQDEEKDIPNTFKLNVGGTKYEVSNSLLDCFPNSMLRRITSDAWREGATDSQTMEIFIDRNGERFQYILDFMRDNVVVLPLSVPRGQLITE